MRTRGSSTHGGRRSRRSRPQACSPRARPRPATLRPRACLLGIAEKRHEIHRRPSPFPPRIARAVRRLAGHTNSVNLQKDWRKSGARALARVHLRLSPAPSVPRTPHTCAMNEDQVQKQIEQMVKFIRQEAVEKAREIHVKAEEEFNIEKLRMVEAEKARIRSEYERKEKDIEVTKRMCARGAARACASWQPAPSRPVARAHDLTAGRVRGTATPFSRLADAQRAVQPRACGSPVDPRGAPGAARGPAGGREEAPCAPRPVGQVLVAARVSHRRGAARARAIAARARQQVANVAVRQGAARHCSWNERHRGDARPFRPALRTAADAPRAAASRLPAHLHRASFAWRAPRSACAA